MPELTDRTDEIVGLKYVATYLPGGIVRCDRVADGATDEGIVWFSGVLSNPAMKVPGFLPQEEFALARLALTELIQSEPYLVMVLEAVRQLGPQTLPELAQAIFTYPDSGISDIAEARATALDAANTAQSRGLLIKLEGQLAWETSQAFKGD